MTLSIRCHRFQLFSVFTFAIFWDHVMQVYVIDFGLAKKYRDLQTHKHIPYRYFFFLCLPHGA